MSMPGQRALLKQCPYLALRKSYKKEKSPQGFNPRKYFWVNPSVVI
jgi:hypothetical protein